MNSRILYEWHQSVKLPLDFLVWTISDSGLHRSYFLILAEFRERIFPKFLVSFSLQNSGMDPVLQASLRKTSIKGGDLTAPPGSCFHILTPPPSFEKAVAMTDSSLSIFIAGSCLDILVCNQSLFLSFLQSSFPCPEGTTLHLSSANLKKNSDHFPNLVRLF